MTTNKLKKVSLIIPCFNAEKTIKKCIDSALSQSLPFHEIILVDNNSQDKSKRIYLEYNDLKIINCLKQGASAARNSGLQKASGDYVAFVDSDVELDQDWNKNMCDSFEVFPVVAVQSKIIPSFFNSNERWIDRYRLERKKMMTQGSFIELDVEKNKIAINTAACMYKKDILIQLKGFEELLTRLEDTDLAFKAKVLGEIASNPNAVAYVYYSGTPLDYLIRSFKDGKAQPIFNQLWNLPQTKLSVVCVNGFLTFSLLNTLFQFLGSLYGKITIKKMPPRSLQAAQLLSKLKTLNLL
jgi:glycosyltransferase involved in cell wall biosynthesis